MSIGTKVGKAIGITAALAVEGAVRGATGLGRFGEDVMAETSASYERKSAQLLITRQAAAQKREALLAAAKAQHKLTMSQPAEAAAA